MSYNPEEMKSMKNEPIPVSEEWMEKQGINAILRRIESNYNINIFEDKK